MKMDLVPAKSAISKAELHQRLRQFVAETAADDATDPNIGPAELVGGHLGNTKWVHVIENGALFCLHADVRRTAVVEYLKRVDRYGDDLTWTVVPNRRGKENAVAYGPDVERVTPFYMYWLKQVDESVESGS